MNLLINARRISFIFLLATAATACNDDSNDAQPQTTDGPSGTTTMLRTGTLTAENGTPTAGTVSLVRDANNAEWISMADNFRSEFGTGTVAVYLAKTAANVKSQRTNANGSPNGAGNVLATGFVTMNGKQYLKLPASSSPFPYVIFYCETVEINFGNAQLK